MQGTELFASLVGSVTLLLWGVRMVRTGMTRTFGAALRRLLAAFTSNRFYAFASGLGVTVLVQSSTATALLLASFCGRGLIGLSMALAVMLGANVGTALAAQIFSFDVNGCGPRWSRSACSSSCRSKPTRRAASRAVFIGLGLMLLALDLIDLASGAAEEIRAFRIVLGAASPANRCSLFSLRRSAHLARPFEPLDRAAGHVAGCARAAADAAGVRSGARRQCRRRDRAVPRPSGSPPAGAARAARQSLDAAARPLSRPVPACRRSPIGRDMIEIDPGRHGDQFPHARSISSAAAACSLPLTGLFAKLCARLCRSRASSTTVDSRAISIRTCSTRPPRRSPARCARRSTWATASPTCCARRWSCSRNRT